MTPEACPICGSNSAFRWEIPHGVVLKCRGSDCGCEFRVSSDTLDEEGLGDEHAAMRDEGPMDSPEVVFGRVLPHLKLILSDRERPRLLDFGAGAAPLFPVAERLGFDYTGVEFDATARVSARATHDLDLHVHLETLSRESRFDLVVMSEVVEHLPDPVAVLSALRGHLASGGLLYLSTPNAKCLKARLQRSRWSSYLKRGHLLYFDERTIKHALFAAGFRSVRRIQVYVPFPNHSLPGRALQRILVKLRWDGALRMVAEA